MFEFNPNLIQEDDSDDEDGETVYYARRQEVNITGLVLITTIVLII